MTPVVASAQPEFEQFRLSPDITAKIPNSMGPGVFKVDDREYFIIEPDGSGTGAPIFGVDSLIGADLDALHFPPFNPAYYSLDQSRLINDVLIRPSDVFSLQFSNDPPVLIFDAQAAGVPDGVNLDAVTVNEDTGNLVVSFDRFFSYPGLDYVHPSDLIEVTDGQLGTVLFDGELRLRNGINVDAAHWVNNEFLLLSFDIDTSFHAGSGFISVGDDDIVLYSRSDYTFASVLSMRRDSHPSWNRADLDALWAKIAVNAGAFRFTTAFREVSEDAGTIVLTVQRVDGAETAVQARVSTVNGTAVAGSDFGSVNQVLSWADGDSSSRAINITIVNDSLQELNPERFSVQLAVESGDAGLGAPSQVQINILDNDGQNLFSDGFES